MTERDDIRLSNRWPLLGSPSIEIDVLSWFEVILVQVHWVSWSTSCRPSFSDDLASGQLGPFRSRCQRGQCCCSMIDNDHAHRSFMKEIRVSWTKRRKFVTCVETITVSFRTISVWNWKYSLQYRGVTYFFTSKNKKFSGFSEKLILS